MYCSNRDWLDRGTHKIKGSILFKLVLLGIFGALLNLLEVPFFLYEINLALASSLVYVIAVYRDIKSAFMVGVISSLSLIDSNWNLWLFLLYSLEALCISFLYRNYINNLLFSALCYWVLVGIPLSLIQWNHLDAMFEHQSYLYYIKLIFNALVNVVIASVIIANRWGYKLFVDDRQSIRTTLRKVYALHLSIILLAITLCTSNVIIHLEIQEAYTHQKNQRNVLYNKIKSDLNVKINSNSLAINEVVHSMSYVWDNPEERKKHLKTAHNRLSFFYTLLIADSSGEVIDVSIPEKSHLSVPKTGKLMIDDREYFVEAMKTNTAYISPGFKGRGIGTEDIAVISHSVPNLESNDKLGIIQGSMLLEHFKEIKSFLNESEFNKGVLLDQNNNVLFASDSLNLKPLSVFTSTKNEKTVIGLDFTRINLGADKNYFFYDEKLDWGWKLILLEDDKYLIEAINRYIALFSIVVIFIIVLAEIVAVILSKYWTQRLSNISRAIQHMGFSYNSEELDTDVETLPEELKVIYKSIETINREIKLVKQNLYETLRSQSQQYQTVSAQLEELQKKDYLTGLDNRETFNRKLSQIWQEKKNNYQALSIIVLAIDDFREINSQRGEIFGDNLLAQLSKKLLEISEETSL